MSQNRATLQQAKKCPSFDYPINYFPSKITHQANTHTHLIHCITYRVPVCILTDDATKLKKSYGSHIIANFKENTFVLGSRIGLHYSRQKKCPSFDYPINYFPSKNTHQANTHTHLIHCITYRDPVCILTDDATKLKKSFGSHIIANFKENTIVLCPRIGLHYSMQKICILLTTLSIIFQVKIRIRQIRIHI